MKFSAFKIAQSKKPIDSLTLDQFVKILRNPSIGGDIYIKAANTVELIRATTDEIRQKKLKLTLPAISPGVEFGSNREDILSYSGLMQIDIDHVSEPEKLRKRLGSLSWVTLSALSVRKGVWLLIKIPEPHRQPEYWESINNWLQAVHKVEADPARQNPKDLRFYAPDSGVIYKPISCALNVLPERQCAKSVIASSNQKKSITGHYLSPLDDYNQQADVIDLLIASGWKFYNQFGKNIRLTRPGKQSGISANWNEELRRLFVFTSNSIFQTDNRSLSPVDVFMKLNQINNLSIARNRLQDLGYGYHH